MLSIVLAAVLQVGDMARIVDLEEPAISPDGSRIALLAIGQDLAHAAYVNRLIVVNVRSESAQTLVRGRDVAVPRWSPRGYAVGLSRATLGKLHSAALRP